jgi:hypothetical protein
VTTNEFEAQKDSCFLEYIPRKMMLDEVLLFENQDWLYRRNNCTVIGLTFADVKEGVDRQLEFVKEKLTRYTASTR